MQTVKDMTPEDLKELIAEVVEEKVRELLADPDEGLVIRPEVEKRLRSSLTQPRKLRRTVPVVEIARRFRVEW